MIDIFHIKTISEVHEQYGLPKPSHPMVSVITDFSGAQHIDLRKIKVTTELYSISLKSKSDGAFRYGRKTYDFQEGTLIFLKPNQVAGYDDGDEPITPESTWNLLFHPDLIRKSELGRVINDYTFFDYDAREALHLSNEEKRSINEIIGFIKKEVSSTIDKHSQDLIISNIKLLLDYCRRYFDRQFYTRQNLNSDKLAEFEAALIDYYDTGIALEKGTPTVSFLGERLGLSPYYLSDLLKKETGKNTIEHIHHFIVNRAKNSLLSTNKSISEIAYGLGFEYPQHFAQVFKKKTGLTPSEFRKTF